MQSNFDLTFDHFFLGWKIHRFFSLFVYLFFPVVFHVFSSFSLLWIMFSAFVVFLGPENDIFAEHQTTKPKHQIRVT